MKQFGFMLFVLIASSCQKNDLNTPCRLAKANPDGGVPLAIKESELRNATVKKEFVSFGASECEELVCVRDSLFTSDAGDDSSAMGYCSRPCVDSSACLSSDAKLNTGTSALSCRTVSTLQGESRFCARGPGT
jgi:hypothetical protein